MKLKPSVLMMIAGVLVIVLGACVAWYFYNVNHSPLDAVNTSLQALDQNSNYIPMVQPRSDQKAPTLAGTNNDDANATGQIIATPTVPAQPVEGSASVTPFTGMIPDRLVIPAIFLDAPIVPIHYKSVVYQDQSLEQWLAPNQYAAGWQDTSALLGLPGNTVLNGHHNANGQVFKDLIKLAVGDTIEIYSGDNKFSYLVEDMMLLPERFQPIEVRMANAQWIMPSDDERITLITCWPATGNDDRVVIVAFPIK